MITKINGIVLPEKIVESIQEAPAPVQLSDGSQQLLLGAAVAMAVPHSAVAATQISVPAFATASTLKGAMITAAATAVNTSGFFRLLDAIIAITDPIATGVVVFAGLAWMFNHRTKSIDLLIGVGAGVLIINHAHDLVKWLEHII